MDQLVRFVGENHALELLGVRLVGVNVENGKKLLFSLVLIILAWAIGALLRKIFSHVEKKDEIVTFWIRQAIRVAVAVLLIIGLLSIWFDQPARLATAMGLVTAGLAFALQRVVTAVAGYLVILKGNTFNVGDRIVMGGVRGDVIALNFIQTTIMEMGQPPPVQNADPAMWIRSRQYTGRLVRVSNDKIFDTPVFNYTKEFPYIWEEMTIPVSYKDDRSKAETILLQAAERHTTNVQALSTEDLMELERRYAIAATDTKPKVYWQMTDNWLNLTVRFIARDHGVRDLKDAMTREILVELEKANIGIASATFEIVGLPKLHLTIDDVIINGVHTNSVQSSQSSVQ